MRDFYKCLIMLFGAVIMLAGCGSSVYRTVDASSQPLTITTASIPNGIVGSSYSATIAASGGTAPYTYSATGLPSGLSINSSTGAITGTLAANTVGVMSVSITVKDSTAPAPQSAAAVLPLTVSSTSGTAPSQLVITTASLPGGTVGAAYSGTVAASGGTAPYTYSATGLPANLTINKATGVITGTPAAAGTSSVAITVTDSSSPAQTATITLSLVIAAVGAPPATLVITTASLPSGTAGTAYSSAVAATGGTMPYTYSATGLPASLTINSATGAITGTPTTASVGTAHVVITVKDSGTPAAQTASVTLSLVIAAASAPATLVISTSSLPSGTAGTAYSVVVAATGGTKPYTYSATGLPANLTINSATGAITGTPASAGTASIVVTVKDAGTPTAQTATATLSLTIAAASAPATLVISTASLPSGTAGTAYSGSVAATGGTKPYTYSATGLPANLTINRTTGAITGTPASAGTASVVITVKDAGTPTAQTASSTLSLTIQAATAAKLVITTASLPGGTAGTAYSSTVAATGGTTPYKFSATGLPTNLAINSATGVITGTPASAGAASVVVTVTDSGTPTAQTASATLSLTIAAAASTQLTITTTALSDATAGTAYTAAIVATGGTAPYTYSATGLPSALTISSITGAITGTPATSVVGTASVVFTVKDSSATQQTATATLSLIVNAAGTAASCGNMTVGELGSLNGFVPFPASNAWNTNITSAPVDSNSASIIAALGTNGSAGLHPDFSNIVDGAYGIPYVVVDSSVTPGVNVDFNQYANESDVMPYPIPVESPANTIIEGQPGNCSVVGDDHVLVLDRNKCWLYETWSTELCNGTWSAANGAVWDLSNYENRPYGWTSADAAGLPVFPGLVRYDEVSAGAINHALRMTMNNTLDGYFIPPATHSAGTSSITNDVIGMRLRLKSTFDISGFSAANQVILKAMQTYGVIIADNGSNMYFQGTPDARWDDDDLNNLKTVEASDFDVIDASTPTYPGYDASTTPTGAAPAISSFTASQASVPAGTTVTLSWSVTGDSYDYIDVVGPVRNGSQTVTPTATTTYTLNSTNAYGRTTKAVTVTVQ